MKLLVLHLSYVERLKKLAIYSIYGGLVLAELIKCLNSSHSEGNIGLLNYSSLVVERRTRERSWKIVLPRCDESQEMNNRSVHIRVIHR